LQLTMEHVHPLPLRPRRRSHWLRLTAFCLLVVLLVAGVAAWMASRRLEPWLRARIVDELGQRFQARVELDGFHVWVANGLWVEGQGLRIWPPANVVGAAGQAASQPLLRLEKFRFHTPLSYKPGKPVHITTVQLDGLTVDLPPKSVFATANAGPANHASPAAAHAPAAVFPSYLHFQVDTMECNRASLTLETSKPGKLPLTIPISFLRLTKNGDSGTLGFEAQLTNPRPAGQVRTAGNFGPWKTSDPGETPIRGQFRLEQADLSTISGIAGKLDAVGQYQGTLRDLTVGGETRVANFSLQHFGTEMPLRARFRATVDATNGDTWLQPVEATLGSSHFRAQGSVVRVLQDGSAIGHDVHLDVDVDRGRIEDFLRLTSRGTAPILTGVTEMKTSFDLPPGQEPVHQRLHMKGNFVLADALFTNPKIQSRIDELSARGLGKGKAVDPETRSAMTSSFTMAGGAINLPDLVYTVPGATIQLKGNYGMDAGTLDFAGNARLQASVSKIVGGWQGDLLKPLDRFFSKGGGGTDIPIRIGGTRENPDFGANLGPFKFDSAQHASHKH